MPGMDPFSALTQGAPENFGQPVGMYGPPGLIGDMYPVNQEKHDQLVNWCNAAFNAAEAARRPFDERWRRYYRLYRSYIEKTPGDWHSTVFIPLIFWIIETITPRLVAQLPKFTAQPVGPDDLFAAKNMEIALDWATDKSDLYPELVAGMRSALKYGTGILKTFHRQDLRRARIRQPTFMPLNQVVPQMVMNPDGTPIFDLNGDPVIEMRETTAGYMPTGESQQVFQYVSYDGPAAECIDIFRFWPAPEAKDEQSARYVIHQVMKDWSEVQARIEEGVYRLPQDLTVEELTDTQNDPALERLASVGLGGGGTDPTRRMVELLEFWTRDGRVITMVNRKALLRVQENPFDHSEKPFVRLVDHYQEHEFWGIGEIEPLEGLQDLRNAITNSRIDNVRLLLNKMFAVNINNVLDMRDLTRKPGGIIRIQGQMRAADVIEPIEEQDVTASSYQETEAIDRDAEKTSGVTGAQMGMETESMSETATGTAILTEQGASRFGLKTKLHEMLGFKKLGIHYASILQQFMPDQMQIRLGLTDPMTGQPMFATLTPDSVEGRMDIDIESESSTQTQTMKVEQKQGILALMAQFWPQGIQQALSDVLEASGEKDLSRYGLGQVIDPMMQMQMGVDPATGQPALPPGPQGMEPQGMDPYAAANPAYGTDMGVNAVDAASDIYNQGAQM